MNINLSSVPRFRAGAYGAMVADESGEFVKVADLAQAEETHSLQCWPNGKSYTYRGDIHAPTIEVREAGIWRTATEEEHGQIKINVLANLYADRDVFCCDSGLIGDLVRAAASGDVDREIAREFEYEEIRNIYADPSDWDADACLAYMKEHDLDAPDVPEIDCLDCSGSGEIGDDSATAAVCGTCKGSGNVPEDGYDEDESRHGWLTEAREVCREHAQDNPAEVYEWWRVSSWLCAALHSIGEVTIDNGYGYWWGRCATGQGFIMDGTLQKVAAR